VKGGQLPESRYEKHSADLPARLHSCLNRLKLLRSFRDARDNEETGNQEPGTKELRFSEN
jgi:hypothetical protein